LARQSDDWLYIEFKIDSFALRKKLAWELSSLYKDRNLIFSQFSKDSPVFTVRKWKERQPKDAQINSQVKRDVKIECDQLENSVYDQIAKG